MHPVAFKHISAHLLSLQAVTNTVLHRKDRDKRDMFLKCWCFSGPDGLGHVYLQSIFCFHHMTPTSHSENVLSICVKLFYNVCNVASKSLLVMRASVKCTCVYFSHASLVLGLQWLPQIQTRTSSCAVVASELESDMRAKADLSPQEQMARWQPLLFVIRRPPR